MEIDNDVITLDYQRDEVISAQRMRFLHSGQAKLMIVLGTLATLALGTEEIWFWYTFGEVPRMWFMPFSVLLLFCAVFCAAYYFFPAIDFRVNPQWRVIFHLHLEKNKFRLSVKGHTHGEELEWGRIKRVLENEKVYILFWGKAQEFIIIPKRVLKGKDEMVVMEKVLPAA